MDGRLFFKAERGGGGVWMGLGGGELDNFSGKELFLPSSCADFFWVGGKL